MSDPCQPPSEGEDSAAAARSGSEPAALAERPLFEPFAALLRGWPPGGLPTVEAIDRRLGAGRYTTDAGRPIRFVPPDGDPAAYERRIHERGEVATRPGSWHDFFNALAWVRYPRAKAALNALHVAGATGPAASGRGGMRDAATQFDESGIVVLGSDPGLLELLAQRAWVELFWHRRPEVIGCMRFLVFGHGLLDALRAPFTGLCGRAVLLAADRTVVESDVAAQAEHADAALAGRCARGEWHARAKALTPVPVLGIPGVTPRSECRAYYEDTRQFRRPPAK